MIPVDVAVPGCPPPPIEILRGILTAVRRLAGPDVRASVSGGPS